MRKILMSFLMVSVGTIYAHGEDRFRQDRSTEPLAVNNAVISTVSARIEAVIVTSGSISPSELYFVGTTSMPMSTDLTLTRTTGTVYDCSTRFVFPVEKNYPYGFGYYYSGTAKIRIKWNYMQQAPKGFESVGY